MPRKIGAKTWAELRHKDSILGASIPQYLDYLLRLLDCTLDMFGGLAASYDADHPIRKTIDRERNDAIGDLIRLQSGLRWTGKNGTIPYIADTGDAAAKQIDHVIEVKDMVRDILSAPDGRRREFFVRAWLAPVCRISGEAHKQLPGQSTASLESGFPFRRYCTHAKQVLAFGQEIDIKSFQLAHHYALLGKSEHFAKILDAYNISRHVDVTGTDA